MFAWLAENAVTVITVSVLIIITGLAVFSLIREKKSKKGACTGNCASCSACCSSKNKVK